MSLAANRVKGIRVALCTKCHAARMAREHSGARILRLGGRVIGGRPAMEIVQVFLSRNLLGGRHGRRVDVVTALETGSPVHSPRQTPLQC